MTEGYITRERVTKEGVTEGLSDREEGTKGSDMGKSCRDKYQR